MAVLYRTLKTAHNETNREASNNFLKHNISYNFILKNLYFQTIREAESSMVAEHQAAVDELKKNEALAKDPLKLQEAIEKKWPAYQRNMVRRERPRNMGHCG